MKNYYLIKLPFKITDKEIVIWKNKKNGGTKYIIMIWQDDSITHFKFGKQYGFGSCFETILPNYKSNIKPLKISKSLLK